MGIVEGAAEPAGVAATFRVLLTRPGQLTEEAIAGIGRSARPRPLFLFLVCSVAYFLSVPIVNRLAGPAPVTPSVTDARTLDGVVSAIEAQSSQSPLMGLVWRQLGPDRIRRILTDPAPLDDALANAFTSAMFLLMPFFAALTWIVWRSADTRYSVHLWFAAHLHAAWFVAIMASQLMSVLGSTALNVLVGLAVLIYSTWYATVAMRRVLGGTNAEFYLRSALVGLAYAVGLFVAVCGLMLFALTRL